MPDLSAALALVGHEEAFTKTVSESDVYGFAGITGDFAPNHVDEAFMATTRYGGRIAHGALVLGFTSTATTMMAAKIGGHAVSLGYDRVRFIGAVRFGETITVRARLASVDVASSRANSELSVTTADGTQVLAAVHILKFVD